MYNIYKNLSHFSGASSQLSEGIVQLEPDDPEPEPILNSVPTTIPRLPPNCKSKPTKTKGASCKREKKATSTAEMVRVYSQPPALGQRQLTPSQSVTSGFGANGFQVREYS